MISELLQMRIKETLQNPVVRGTLWQFSARIASLSIQIAYFFIIARFLGVEQYGLFIGAMSFIKILVPFAHWGTPHLLVKHVSRDRDVFSQYWGNTLVVTLGLGTLFIGVTLLVNQLILGNNLSTGLLLYLGIAELICGRIHEAALKAFIATQLFRYDAQLSILLSLNGLIAALCLVAFVQAPTALIWGGLYLLSRGVTAAIGLNLVERTLGRPRADLRLLRPDLLQGFYFSLDISSQTIYNDIDKTILASTASLAATGAYAAAYRLLDVCMMPILALMGATYAQFFRRGADGIQGSFQVARRVVPMAAGYGAIACIGLWVFSPLVPAILGEDYRESVVVLRWLAPLLIFKSFQYFAADTLTGAGLQGARSALQATIAITNLLLNLWLIPRYSWLGAAWASLVSDGALTIGLWSLVAIFYRQQQRSTVIAKDG